METMASCVPIRPYSRKQVDSKGSETTLYDTITVATCRCTCVKTQREPQTLGDNVSVSLSIVTDVPVWEGAGMTTVEEARRVLGAGSA